MSSDKSAPKTSRWGVAEFHRARNLADVAVKRQAQTESITRMLDFPLHTTGKLLGDATREEVLESMARDQQGMEDIRIFADMLESGSPPPFQDSANKELGS